MKSEQIKQLIEKDPSFILKVNKPSLEMIDLAFKKDVNLYFQLNKKKNNKILEVAIRNNLDLNLIEENISKDLLMKALDIDVNNLLKFEKKSLKNLELKL